MSYIVENFKSGRGIVFANSPMGTVAMHTYASVDDTTYDILTAGYFPANYGLLADEVTNADYLWVSGSNASVLVKMTNVDTAPILYAQLSYYSLSGTFSLTFEGPWVANVTVSCKYTLQNSAATIVIPSVVAAAADNGLIQTTGTFIPGTLLPIENYYQLTRVFNPLGEEGWINVNNITGAVVSQPFAAFAMGANDYGFPAVKLSYFTNTTPP